MHVRRLDWAQPFAPGESSAEAAAAAARSPSTAAVAKSDGAAPALDPTLRFEAVIGSDVLYEAQQAAALAATVAARLEPGGRCLLCCTIREQATFDAFERQLARRRLRRAVLSVQPLPEDTGRGVMGRQHEYEGGFALVAIDHADAHAAGGWHRSDLGF
jgi:hypothetical protein